MRLTDRQQKQLALALWLLLIVGFLAYAYQQGTRPDLLFRQRISEASTSALAPLLLIVFYIIRPFFLLPITFLTAAAGFLFGFWLGLAYASLAKLLSVSIAYGIGRFFQNEAVLEHPRIKPLAQRLTSHSFETVLIGRLLMIPGDLVSFPAGLLKINLLVFLVASTIGGLPGMLIGVIAGASIEGDLASGQLSINPWLIVTSLLLVVFSLGLSYLLRKRSSFVQL